MELKTLKDIWDKYYRKGMSIACRDELKQEAIKWVKKYKNSKEKLTMLHEAKASEIFMDFFNITEEELKGGNQDGNKTRKN